MARNKKLLSILLSTMILASITLSGCGDKTPNPTDTDSELKTTYESQDVPIETKDTPDSIETNDIVSKLKEITSNVDSEKPESDTNTKEIDDIVDDLIEKIDTDKTTNTDTSTDSEPSIDTNTEKDTDTNTDTDTNEDTDKNTMVSNTKLKSKEDNVVPSYTQNHREYEHYDNWIWVGDSRTVGMAGDVGITYLAKSAMGLDWFAGYNGYPGVSHELDNLKGYNIVFNFGINDYWNLDYYIWFYNNLPEQIFENNKVFMMSVNPVDEVKQVAYGYGSSNATLEWFNENLKNNLRDDIEFIDSYTYLQETGFDTIDGIHYDRNTDIKIYNFIVNTITWSPDNDIIDM